MEAYLKHIYRDLRELEEAYLRLTRSDEFSLDLKYSLSQLFDYDIVNFPPSEYLSSEQKGTLAKRIETLLSLSNLSAPIPLHLDNDTRYRLFFEVWNQSIVSFTEVGVGQIKFCDGQISSCSFGASNCICGAKFNDEEAILDRKKAS